MWRHELIQLQFFKGEWGVRGGGVIGRRGRWKGGGPAQRRCCVARRPGPQNWRQSRAISHCERSTNGDELRGDGCRAVAESRLIGLSDVPMSVRRSSLSCLFWDVSQDLLPWPAENRLDCGEFLTTETFCPLSFLSVSVLLNSLITMINRTCLLKNSLYSNSVVDFSCDYHIWWDKTDISSPRGWE